MNTLKEQNGRYYQEVEVVMLATDKSNPQLFFHCPIGSQRILAFGQGKGYHEECMLSGLSKPQHLYFLSDEEIKEGDWFIYNNAVMQCIDVDKSTNYIFGRTYKTDGSTDGQGDLTLDKCKKIIATTDKSLNYLEGSNDTKLLLIPKPSDSFIKKYIEEYNAGRQITKVLVEYVKHPVENYWYIHSDSDYEITITKLKDSYSREEIERMLEDAVYYGANHGNPLNYSIVKQYIKENL